MEGDWSKPQQVSDVDLAFPAGVMKLMPKHRELPEEFQYFGNNPWIRLASKWFGSGIPKEQQPTPKEGIDANLAWRHLGTIMGSWEPKHEHKIGGVAWLMSQWFELPANGQGAA